MRGVVRLLVTALAITGFALGAGLLLTLGPGHHHSATPAAPPTSRPLADVDTTHLAVQRQAFCEAVPPALVTQALGATPSAATSYVDGQRAALTPSTTDLAHEFDCTWTAGSRTARAWVFAPPVTPAQAQALTAEAASGGDCRRLSGFPPFGDPTVVVRCKSADGPVVSYRGLFGDAWLACSLSGDKTDSLLADEAGRWCGSVAEAAAS